MIQGAGPDAYQHFIGFDRWLRNVFVFQNLRSAVLVDSDRLHKLTVSRGLQLKQLRVAAAQRHQLFMRALLDDFAVG